MSHLPEISQEQRNKNVKKLIIQNKKLRQEIQAFQQQINLIFSSQPFEESLNKTNNPIRKSIVSQKKQSFALDNQLQNQSKTLKSPENFSKQQIENKSSNNSSFIEKNTIPFLKEIANSLKGENIKDNVHYILKEQDDLKILKNELYKLRKEKQVMYSFIKDKSEKLQKNNNQLISHKKSLQEELNMTIKFNRSSANKVSQLERQIRKYHSTIHQLKKLHKQLKSEGKERKKSNQEKSNQFLHAIQESNQLLRLKTKISTIQNKWKPKIDALDFEYYEIKEKFAAKILEEENLRREQNFYKTRILTIKDQLSIQKQRYRKKLAKVNPRLQKQLEDYRKQERQKLFKKQQYLKKHRPRDKDEQIFKKIQNQSALVNPNPQNTQVETLRDDKNIIKLKNYLKKKSKVDKQIATQFPKSYDIFEKDRMQRSWIDQKQDTSQALKSFNSITEKNQNLNDQDNLKPRILLKSIKLGTTFHQ